MLDVVSEHESRPCCTYTLSFVLETSLTFNKCTNTLSLTDGSVLYFSTSCFIEMVLLALSTKETFLFEVYVGRKSKSLHNQSMAMGSLSNLEPKNRSQRHHHKSLFVFSYSLPKAEIFFKPSIRQHNRNFI